MHEQSGRRAKPKFTRFFPCVLRLNTVFMLATLEPNTSYNHLYDSILRHTRNCIDAPSSTSKIKLPKPHHVVPIRALYTIGCGLQRTQSPLFRVLAIRGPKSGAASRVDPFAADLIA